MSRTTIDIDPSVLAEAKALARKRGRTLGETLSILVARALAGERDDAHKRPPFRWHSQPMGLKVDLEDKDAVEWALDGDHLQRMYGITQPGKDH